jgi:hypothetical protein
VLTEILFAVGSIILIIPKSLNFSLKILSLCPEIVMFCRVHKVNFSFEQFESILPKLNSHTMKTKTFLWVCILTVLSISTAIAQNRVSKFESAGAINGDYLECTGDYLYGSFVAENWASSHNFLIKIRDAVLYGYKDPAGTIPSGNVYEYAGTSPGLNNFVATGQFRVNGKTVGQYQFHFHQTTNANVVITVEFFSAKFNCK